MKLEHLHTPGPWYYEVSVNTPSTYDVRNGHCTIAAVERWDEEPKKTQLETEANARLIAAAPSLFNQLAELGELVEAHLAHGDVADKAFVEEIERTAELLRTIDDFR